MKKELIKSLCSYIKFSANYRKGIFNVKKNIEITVYFTPSKVVYIDPIEYPIELNFKLGDPKEEVIQKIDSKYEILEVKRKLKK
jgi:hypothetical protein